MHIAEYHHCHKRVVTPMERFLFAGLVYSIYQLSSFHLVTHGAMMSMRVLPPRRRFLFAKLDYLLPRSKFSVRRAAVHEGILINESTAMSHCINEQSTKPKSR